MASDSENDIAVPRAETRKFELAIREFGETHGLSSITRRNTHYIRGTGCSNDSDSLRGSGDKRYAASNSGILVVFAGLLLGNQLINKVITIRTVKLLREFGFSIVKQYIEFNKTAKAALQIDVKRQSLLCLHDGRF